MSVFHKTVVGRGIVSNSWRARWILPCWHSWLRRYRIVLGLECDFGSLLGNWERESVSGISKEGSWLWYLRAKVADGEGEDEEGDDDMVRRICGDFGVSVGHKLEIS